MALAQGGETSQLMGPRQMDLVLYRMRAITPLITPAHLLAAGDSTQIEWNDIAAEYVR